MSMSYGIWLKVAEIVPSQLQDPGPAEGIVTVSTLVAQYKILTF